MLKTKKEDRHSSDDISCFDCTVFAYSFPVDKSFCFDLWPHALCALLAGWIIVNNLKCPTVGADRFKCVSKSLIDSFHQLFPTHIN